MLNLAMGLMWLAISLSLFVAADALEQRGIENTRTLALFAAVLTVYNFVRFGVSRLGRRQGERAELPLCPRCRRPMKLERDLQDPHSYKIACCGCQLQIDNESERLAMIERLRRYHRLP